MRTKRRSSHSKRGNGHRLSKKETHGSRNTLKKKKKRVTTQRLQKKVLFRGSEASLRRRLPRMVAKGLGEGPLRIAGLEPTTDPRSLTQRDRTIMWRRSDHNGLFLDNRVAGTDRVRSGEQLRQDVAQLAREVLQSSDRDAIVLPDTIIVQTPQTPEAITAVEASLLELLATAGQGDRRFVLSSPVQSAGDDNQILLTYRVTEGPPERQDSGAEVNISLRQNPLFSQNQFPFDYNSNEIEDTSISTDESEVRPHPLPRSYSARLYPDDELNQSLLRSVAPRVTSAYTRTGEKLRDIWQEQTRSLNRANRGQNERTILEIDDLLFTLDAERDPAQRAVQLARLDDLLAEWRRDLSGSRVEAARRLHEWVRAQRLIRDTIQPDRSIIRLADNPLRLYMSWRDRRERHPRRENFPMPEMADTLKNMRAHLDEIKLRLVYGMEDEPLQDDFRCQVHANVSNSLKRELLDSPVLDHLAREIESLARAEDPYPYRDTMRFIIKFMKVIEYITFRAKTQPELERAGIPWSDFQPGGSDWEHQILTALNEIRNERFSKRLNEVTFKKAAASFSTFMPGVTIDDIYSGNYRSDHLNRQIDNNVGDNGVGIFGFEQEGIRGDRNVNRLEWLIDHRDVIIFPSYQPLDERFFNHIRNVPVFVLGMINVEYLNADNVRLSPGAFFVHDTFHTIGHIDSVAKFLYDTMEEQKRKWMAKGFSEESVYAFWTRNWDHLLVRITESVGKDLMLVDAIHKVLFMALHEIPPSVLEADLLADRLDSPGFLDKLGKRIQNGEFGKVHEEVPKRLEEARDWLLDTIAMEKVFLKEPTR